jgi:hypothetical protein
MTRDVLQAILRGAQGLSDKAGVFRAEPDTRVTFYLGQDGRGITANEIETVKLLDLYVSLSSRELGEVACPYDSVFAVAVKPPKESGPKKTGFA